MTRLIRWAHLADGRISVLWVDGHNIRTTICDGITLERLEGEPLSKFVRDAVEHDEGAPRSSCLTRYYVGVIQPAQEALC